MARMTFEPIQLTIGGDRPDRSTVTIHGQDLANYVRGFTLHARVGGEARLILDLAVFDATNIHTGEAAVHMDKRVHDLLIKAGWTPPEGDNPTLLAVEQQ